MSSSDNSASLERDVPPLLVSTIAVFITYTREMIVGQGAV